MRILVVLLISAWFLPVTAGTWKKEGVARIRFRGPIESGEFERFRQVFSETTEEIIVSSRGGVTGEALKIAEVLASRPVKIVVENVCLSSCANYLFVAGGEREIRRGIVGFHGNVQACFLGKKREAYIARLKSQGLDEASIKKTLAETEEEARIEKTLLDKRGISQEFFEIACSEDKGSGKGGRFEFWLPKKATFEKYGFKKIVGEQDARLIKKFPAKTFLWE